MLLSVLWVTPRVWGFSEPPEWARSEEVAPLAQVQSLPTTEPRRERARQLLLSTLDCCKRSSMGVVQELVQGGIPASDPLDRRRSEESKPGCRFREVTENLRRAVEVSPERL
jgi:hypothetical protein